MNKVPVGVSQCLLGERVRYNGDHKRDAYLTNVLSLYLDFQPTCPEVAIGLGTPRPPIHLVATDNETRVRGVENPDQDFTGALVTHAEATAAHYSDLCGFVFMEKSPSCGLNAVKRHNAAGELLDYAGRGAYAQRLTELMPHLPMEESGSLQDPGLRDNFLIRVFALHDWNTAIGTAPSAKKLITFHSRYKYQVMAHHHPSYKALGKLLSNLSEQDIAQVSKTYIQGLMAALAHTADRKSYTNTLMHLRGYLRNALQPMENAELTREIERYYQGDVPLKVPLSLLKQHLAKLDNPYLEQQVFWSPYPDELRLPVLGFL